MELIKFILGVILAVIFASLFIAGLAETHEKLKVKREFTTKENYLYPLIIFGGVGLIIIGVKIVILFTL